MVSKILVIIALGISIKNTLISPNGMSVADMINEKAKLNIL